MWGWTRMSGPGARIRRRAFRFRAGSDPPEGHGRIGFYPAAYRTARDRAGLERTQPHDAGALTSADSNWSLLDRTARHWRDQQDGQFA